MPLVCFSYPLQLPKIEILFREREAGARAREIQPPLKTLDSCATMVLTSQCISVCSVSDEIHQFSLDGQLLREFKVKDVDGARTGSCLICAVDADDSVAMSVGTQLSLQQPNGQHGVVVELAGATCVSDMVFHSRNAFWILDLTNENDSTYSLIKYVIPR